MILAIDPGHWTGWALVKEDGVDSATVVAVGQFHLGELEQHMGALVYLSSALGVRQWVVEGTPDNRPDAITLTVLEAAKSAAVDARAQVETLKPFHWKFLERSVQAPNLVHAKDAAKMGMVFLSRLKTSS